MTPRIGWLFTFAMLAIGPVVAQETPMATSQPPRQARVAQAIEPLQGPDPTLPALARVIRIAADPALSDDDLQGLTGAAFLATVCSNNCNCREWRELALRIGPALTVLGISFEQMTGGDDAAWERVKGSIADGVPVVLWNAFGDHEDALVTGYDLDADLLRGYGVSAAGAGEREGKLSAWKAGGIHGFIVRRGKGDVGDRLRLELDAIDFAVAAALRPALEGG